MSWTEDGTQCQRCHAPLRELPLQVAALRNLVREVARALRNCREIRRRRSAPKIKRLRIAELVPKRRIERIDELDEALKPLRQSVQEALDSGETVELT